MLLNAFRGALVGSLLGDCLGSPFEGQIRITKRVNKFFDRLRCETSHKDVTGVDELRFTDDTAMTWDVANSLIDKHQFDGVDMATRFFKTYYNAHNRGYGGGVIDVFAKWKKLSELEQLRDPFAAATEQFNGLGSYGNGGAMRISPVALFAFNDYDTMLTVARKSTELTHIHSDGVCGAMLQSIALWQVLKHIQLLDTSDSTVVFNKLQFVDELIERIRQIETAMSVIEARSYIPRLDLVKSYLSTNTTASDAEIVENLGNSVSAKNSVPTAIYCFLKYATNRDDQSKFQTGFGDTIRYAVSLGGDTDTIASMAGCLSGAYHGIEFIPSYLKDPCENVKNAIRLADELHALITK